MRTLLLKIFIGIVFVVIAILLAVYFKPGDSIYYLTHNLIPIAILFSSWIIISLSFKKYHLGNKNDDRSITLQVAKINIIIAGLAMLVLYALRMLSLSRFVLFCTLFFGSILEWIFFIACKQVTHSKKINGDELFDEEEGNRLTSDQVEVAGHETILSEKKPSIKPQTKVASKISEYIIEESSVGVYNFISKYIDLGRNSFSILSTTTRFNVLKYPDNHFNYIVNLQRINDIRYINKFFEAVNTKVNKFGVFMGCVETKNMRKRRILKKYPPVLNIIYYFFDYILKRVFPKFQVTKKVYFFLTRGQNRVLSKAETLGRLYSCGFEVLETKRDRHLMYFAVRKIGKPVYDPNPTYGPLVKLRRVGKNGKQFYVFKMRTMHPYSEYLQDYIYKRFNLKEGGKFNHDFRITTAGRFMRQFWIDELPMLINFVKGDMKMVGIRPLSKHYFSLYSKELQEKRTKHKPGLIPPFYADLPKTLEEIQESELKYLNAYEKHPFRTDVKYFFKAIFNIIFKRKRSS